MGKDLSGCVRCMRGLLLILNILFLIVGITLLGVGIYIRLDTKFASALSDLSGSSSNLSSQAIGFFGYMMIIAGVFTILIAFLGCVGTLWCKPCVLWMYAIILLILMVLELTGCIMAVVYKKDLLDVYGDSFEKILTDGVKKNETKILDAFRALEETLTCCGAKNVSDYGERPPVPLSKPCQENPNEGCAEKLIDILEKNLPIIAGTLGGVLALEFFTFFGAIILAIALKHAPEQSYSSSPGEVIRYAVPGRRRDYR